MEIWKRKKSAEVKYGVHIFSPYFQGKLKMPDFSFPSNLQSLYSIVVEGEKSKFEVLEKYVKETFVHPQVVAAFCFDKDLKPILGNELWTDILEEICTAYISIKEGSLNICGTSSSVNSAISAMVEVTMKYNKNEGAVDVEHRCEFAEELSLALRVCKRWEVDVHVLQLFPKEVICLLITWVQLAYKERGLLYDDSVSLDNDILILDVPHKKNVPVIVVDSDDEQDMSSNGHSTKNVPKTNCKRASESKRNKRQKFNA